MRAFTSKKNGGMFYKKDLFEMIYLMLARRPV